MADDGCRQLRASFLREVDVGRTLELRLAPTEPEATFTDTGPFVTDPAATTNTCRQLPDGFWKLDYSGGEPYVRGCRRWTRSRGGVSLG